MLGHVLFSELAKREDLDVWGTVRNGERAAAFFSKDSCERLIPGVEVEDLDSIRSAISKVEPDVIINAIGLIKQHPGAQDSKLLHALNVEFSYRMADLVRGTSIRLIQIGTDCVFDGKEGMYTETSTPSPIDEYGATKLEGELIEDGNLTLRTSFIGHELGTRYGLVEWFLSQQQPIEGYTNAIYSGLPTVEFANILANHVLPDTTLRGLYHVSSDPIPKYDLLSLVAEVYGKDIEIRERDDVRIDRSLDSSAFRDATGYHPPGWKALVRRMHAHYANEVRYS